MPSTVRFTVDASKAKAKLRMLEAKLKREGKLSVEELGRLGQAKARDIAPKDSNRLVQLIQLQRGSGNEAVIVSKNPQGNRLWPNSGVYKGKFSLVKWMHTTRGVFQTDNPFGKAGTKHIKTGDPQYMYRTSSYLRKVAPGRVTGRFNKVVAEINKR